MRRSVLTLGTFDGVHRGHQALVRQVVTQAKKCGAQAVALAFDMPPRHVSGHSSKRVLLTTLSEKLQLLKRLGIDTIHVLRFDRATADTSPEEFFKKIVVEQYRTVAMVVGPRVAFGKDRRGRLPVLKRLGKQGGVRIVVVHAVRGGQGAVASRKIRGLLTHGHVEQATRLLGHPYSLEGRVIHGDHRGRQLGYPTANLEIDARKILPLGVFWVKVFPADTTAPMNNEDLIAGAEGLCNIGTRPTFNSFSSKVRCEVFILGGHKKLYGKKLRIVFMRKIRSEKKFQSPSALRVQIDKDFRTASEWISQYSFTK